ncbi:MAG TPA: PEP-CTERM sorting domain-containing protein [Bryobacteraceae bacterium]|nr:PEP-CTERM sorting domain-containing protein [Bryobacteraceae bacterium]
MKKFPTSAGFGAAIALCALALPGQASTVLSFSSSSSCTVSSGACGTGVASGSSTGSTLSALDMYNLGTLSEQVNGVTVQTWSLTGSPTLAFTNSGGDSFSLTGTLTCTSGCFNNSNIYSGTIFTGTTSSAPTITGGNQSFGYTIGINTSITLTETATLLNDLSLTAPTGTGTIQLGATSGNSSPYSAMDLIASQTLSITQNSSFLTPEPMSFVLFGTGLAAVALIVRRRAQKTAAVKV